MDGPLVAVTVENTEVKKYEQNHFQRYQYSCMRTDGVSLQMDEDNLYIKLFGTVNHIQSRCCGHFYKARETNLRQCILHK